MSSTPPRNPNSNNNPQPIVRSRISGITADDETPPINLTPLIKYLLIEVAALKKKENLKE
jgi:hypothetical protein